MRGEQGLELALGVYSRGRQQPGVDTHCHLMNNACWVGDAVGRLEDGAGSSRGSQEVGHRGSWDQRTRRRVRQQGRLGVRVPSKVGVGARCVVGTAVGECERVPVHGRRDVGLRSPVGKVPIPLLVARIEMLHLKERRTKLNHIQFSSTQIVF